MDNAVEFNTRCKVFLHKATKGTWYYCALSDTASNRIVKFRGLKPRTRHTRSEIQIGETSWRTNIFLDKKQGWLFVIKADVREKESIQVGQTVLVTISLTPK